MKWIEQFQLFLFDFDGLLVNTEPLHYRAYIDVLAKRGCRLDWDFPQFCALAHLHATALKEALTAAWPHLDPDWDSFYAEKKAIYLHSVRSGQVELMPGVEAILKALAEKNIRRCVVTHSPQEQVDQICSQIPILQTIPYWITRHQYEKPKPDPECYLKAIELYGQPGDLMIGFEDSIRGWQALSKTGVKAILVCSSKHPLLTAAQSLGARHVESFFDIEHA
ncbi:MAG: HAD family phosphatase [Chlamydiales bacterium]|nr:HAD family phosphatase [Chlamydiales bacterium]